MELNYFYTILIISILLIISVLTGKLASRFGISSLLGILAIGLALGNGGVYDFDYNNPLLTLKISQIALCFILFSGGFSTRWKKLMEIAPQGISLATIGTLATALITGLAVHFIFSWSMLESLLLGAVISSTDAAAVFSILASSNLKLKNNINYVLEFESGTNDPMAYFLTISLTSLISSSDKNGWMIIPHFLWNTIFGIASGYGFGTLIFLLIKRSKLKKGQTPMMLLAAVLFIFALNELCGGSAFLAVYVAGITLGNKKWDNLDYNLNFYEGLSWLMEAVLFLVLGLQVYISNLGEIYLSGLLISIILIVIARPLATWFTYLFLKRRSWQHKTFISWVGLKGATPIVFALIPLVEGLAVSEYIFNVSFIVVISSILIQGSTVAWLGRVLKLGQ